MTELLPLHVSRISAPSESMFGLASIDHEAQPMPWLDDGTTASVIFVGFQSSCMLDAYLKPREGQQVQIFSYDGQPMAGVLDSRKWTTSVGPEPWIELLLKLPLSQSVLHQSSDFYVLVDDVHECEELRQLIQDPRTARHQVSIEESGINAIGKLVVSANNELKEFGSTTYEEVREMLKQKGLVFRSSPYES